MHYWMSNHVFRKGAVGTEMATEPTGGGRGWLQTGELILGHVVAVVVGFVLMVVGLGLGVTMIMLPVGLVVGLVGVGVFIWGLIGHLGNKE